MSRVDTTGRGWELRRVGVEMRYKNMWLEFGVFGEKGVGTCFHGVRWVRF